MPDATAISITGIVVSGVVGPAASALWARRADRARAERESAATKLRDDEALISEAVAVLAPAATYARRIHSGEPSQSLNEWIGYVYPLGLKIRLRFGASSLIATAYDDVRNCLTDIVDSPAGATGANTLGAKIDAFVEQSRAVVLERRNF